MIRGVPEAPFRALQIDGYTSPADLMWLAARAAEAKVIVEIGSWKGRSTRALADATDGVVYAIDDWNDQSRSYNCARDFTENLVDLIGHKVRHLPCNSRHGIPIELRGAAVDFLFIDGDHSYDGVRSDIKTFAPLVRSGGLIAGHDYSPHHPGVIRAVDEMFEGKANRVEDLTIWWIEQP